MKNWIKLGAVLGVAYCVAGFVLIFLGWNGAASNDRVEAQMPYVVPGGIAGLALVVLGAGLIVAHSLRSDRVELKAAIDELRRSIDVGAPSAAAATVPSAAASGGDEVVAGTQTYHRPTCAVIADQPVATRMRAADAVAAGLEPCRVCHPEQLVA